MCNKCFGKRRVHTHRHTRTPAHPPTRPPARLRVAAKLWSYLILVFINTASRDGQYAAAPAASN